VDTEAHPDLATRYEVASIPNFMVFKNGKAVMRQAGLVPSTEMRRWIEQAMSAAA
jgi:thioredoxin 2